VHAAEGPQRVDRAVSSPLSGALLSSPVLGVRLPTALQVLQVHAARLDLSQTALAGTQAQGGNLFTRFTHINGCQGIPSRSEFDRFIYLFNKFAWYHAWGARFECVVGTSPVATLPFRLFQPAKILPPLPPPLMPCSNKLAHISSAACNRCEQERNLKR